MQKKKKNCFIEDPTYSFKLDTNKNNIHKCDINTKPSTSSSDNQIIFENYTNKSINITNNNKNKGNGKKRKGDNVKKTTKKSKKLKKGKKKLFKIIYYI